MEKIESDLKKNDIVTERPTDWHKVNWQKAYRMVKKLRRRIFRATQEGDWKKVNKLQRLMLRSYSNALISVRQATQLNKGKDTSGIDKMAKLSPLTRGRVVDALTLYKSWKPTPTKRVYIPKSNGKKRPLGIPSMIDRCIQGMVKNALEPHWEALFEPISYGFRPGRSTHDAREKIFKYIKGENNRKWWVLDADISGCFDNIAHEPLMEKIGNFPARKLVEQWLKAGYIHDGVFYNTEAGTPQGGIISPLLANIALHGMEEALGIKYRWNKNPRSKQGGSWLNTSRVAIIRYADDFVILTESKEDAELARTTIEEWLSKMGLELSKEKTKICHLTEGFNFLGWNFRKYKTFSRKTGMVTLIKPSKDNITKFKEGIKDLFKGFIGTSVEKVIRELNPKLRGWGSYHQGVVAKETFSKIDSFIWHKLMRWGKRTHSKKSGKWIADKYFGRLCPVRKDKWVFGNKSKEHQYVEKLGWIPIQRHTLVVYKNSPDDPSLKEYWEKRHAKMNETTAMGRFSKGKDKLALQQGYQCPWCKQDLGNNGRHHVHHIHPKHLGGKDTYDNLIFLHEDCHHSIHALGATNPDIQHRLRAGKTKPSRKRDKDQKVQKRKDRKEVAETLSSCMNWLSRMR